MKDFPNEREQQLFDAGRSERPGSDLLVRCLNPALQRPTAESVLPTLRRSRLPWGIALAAAVLVAVVALALRDESAAVVDITAERLEPVAEEPPPRPVVREKVKGERAPARPKLSAAPVEKVRPAPSVAPRTLQEQLELLKRARGSLRQGESSRALQLLDEYERRRNSVDLGAESTVLRIEALAAAGRTEAARNLAKRFIENSPNSPLVDRVRSFVPEASPGVGMEPAGVERPAGSGKPVGVMEQPVGGVEQREKSNESE